MLKVIIPGEVVAYSHRGIDIQNHMNEESVSELLEIKTKYDYLASKLDIEISEYNEDNIGDDYSISEGADIGLR